MYRLSVTSVNIKAIGLSDLQLSDTTRRMGRPALGVKLTTVRLSPSVLERIDAVMGRANKRGDFIREAVEAELSRREKTKD